MADKNNYRCQLGYIYFPSGELIRVRPADNRRFSLREEQKAVGGYIELIRSNPDLGFYRLFVNEEGQRLDLPINRWTPELIDIVFYKLDFIYRGNIFGVKIEEFDETLPTINKVLKGEKK